MAPDTTVLVAGGGIGGLALGTSLARAGVPVTIVERAAGIADVGAGLVLYPNGVKALTAISPELGAAVRAAGHVPRPGDLRPLMKPDGELIIADDVGALDKQFGAPQVSILRSALQNVLLEQARAAGAELRAGLGVSGHQDHGDHVEVSLSDGGTLTASVLVGADGLNSVVRKRLIDDGAPRYCGYSTMRGRSAPSERYPNGLIVTSPDLGLFVAPIGGGGLYWTAKITAPSGTWPAKDQQAALTDLLGAMNGWHDSIVEVVRTVRTDSTVVLTDINDREPVSRWTSGRVTLLGDAAHPMSPGAGQGASMALEDAAVLGDLLGRAEDLPAALRRYNDIRAPRTAEVVRQSHQRDTVVRHHDTEFSTQDEQIADLFGWRLDSVVASSAGHQ